MGYHSSARGVLNFSDTLIGVDRPFYMGDNWALVSSSDNGTAGVDIAAQLNIGGSGLTYGSGSGINNNSMRVQAYPVPIDWNRVRAKSATQGLFAEIQFVQRVVGIDAEPTLTIFMQPGGQTGYGLNFQSESANVSLFANLGNVARAISTPTTKANGDILRLEVRPSAASNEIKTFKNNILVRTDIDSDATRPTQGFYGLAFLGVFTGTVTMSNFRGGVLSL